MELKTQLIDLLNFSYTQETALVNGLSAAESAMVGAPENWSAKDNLAHISAYRLKMARNLAAVAAGDDPQRTGDLDQENADIFAAHQNDSWEQVLTEHAQAFALLLHEAGRLSEADLNTHGFFPWATDRPLWRDIAGNSALHPLIHVGAYLTQHNHGDQAIGMYEAAVPLLNALDASPAWRGMVQYDLACVYALAGQPSSALTTLKQAFAIAPEIVEWASQDTDLDSLRAEPEFQTLIENNL